MSARLYYPRAVVFLDALVEDFSGGSGRLLSFYAIPRSVEWKANDHREADTFRLELGYNDLPLDPRVLRSVRVAIYVADAPGDVADIAADPRNLRFLGFADEPSQSFGEDGETVTLEGRDYTGPLIDMPWTGESVRIDRPLDAIVRELVDSVPGMEALVVEADAAPVLSTILGRAEWAPPDKADTWSVIVELCGLAGFVAQVRRDRLQIVAPGRAGVASRRFVYGENVLSLDLRRNLHNAKQKQVEVKCWDDQARELRVATWPTSPIVLSSKVSTTKTGKVRSTQDTAPIIPWYVAGAWTVQQLQDLARSIFDNAVRSEVEGTLETKDLDDLDGLDLLGLQNADEIELRLARGDLQSIQGMGEAEAARHIGRFVDDDAVAVALARAWVQADTLRPTFYVRAASHRWSGDGYSLSIDLQNFV